MFSQKELEELHGIYKTELDLEIPDADAIRHAAQLIELLLAVYRDIPDTKLPP